MFTSKDQMYMLRALDLAKQAEKAGEVPVGAVIVLNNQIIAEGWNCPISQHDPSAHAEIVALQKAAKYISNYRLLNTTLYVTLEPCLMCVGAMIHARIKRLVYGASDPKTGAVHSVCHVLSSRHLNHQIICEGGLLEDDCGKLLSSFFEERRKKY